MPQCWCGHDEDDHTQSECRGLNDDGHMECTCAHYDEWTEEEEP